MDEQVMQEAIARVRASEEDVTAYRVHKALVASGHRYISYAEVYQQFIAMRVLTADEEERDASP